MGASVATSKAKPKTKQQANDDNDDDEEDDDEDDSNKTDAQKREDAFREMIARRKGGKKNG